MHRDGHGADRRGCALSTIDEMRAAPGSTTSAPPRQFPMLPRWAVLLVAVFTQVVVSLAIGEIRVFGMAHAAALMLFGLYAALKRDLALVLCVCAYLTGSEVLWRQATIPVPYLAAPYLLILLSGFAVIVGLGRLSRDSRLALLYVALMLPAAINTIRTAGSGSRELIAFALSGPLALAAFVAFTSQVRVAPWLYRRVLWVTLISAVGPLTLAVSRLRADIMTSGVTFNDESNFSASGGFGPVQVSSVLSLGILAAVLLLLCEPCRTARIIAGVVGAAMMVQTLLTFSRGGSFSIAIAVLALAITQARDQRVRRRAIAIGVVALALAYFFVFPWLETFTNGAFQERFSDTTSSRTELAANDTEIFMDNIVLGVGPGMTKYQRLGFEACELRTDNCNDEASSHTEFTRMLGEHGIPGVISIIVLSVLALNAFRRAGPGRGFAIAFLAWTISQMFYANLRIIAVPFAFGMTFLRLTEDDSDEHDPPDDEELAPVEPNGRRSGDPRTAATDRPAGFGAGYGSVGRFERRVGFGAGYGAAGPLSPAGADTTTPGTTSRNGANGNGTPPNVLDNHRAGLIEFLPDGSSLNGTGSNGHGVGPSA